MKVRFSSPGLEWDEDVVEFAILPSGRIVVMGEQDSYWFESNGRNDILGSQIVGWYTTAAVLLKEEVRMELSERLQNMSLSWVAPYEKEGFDLFAEVAKLEDKLDALREWRKQAIKTFEDIDSEACIDYLDALLAKEKR